MKVGRIKDPLYQDSILNWPTYLDPAIEAL